jgi:hypothetical protein
MLTTLMRMRRRASKRGWVWRSAGDDAATIFLGQCMVYRNWVGACKMMFPSSLALGGSGWDVPRDSARLDAPPAEVGSCVGFRPLLLSGYGAEHYSRLDRDVSPRGKSGGTQRPWSGWCAWWLGSEVERVLALAQVLVGVVDLTPQVLHRLREEAGRQARRSFHTRALGPRPSCSAPLPIISLCSRILNRENFRNHFLVRTAHCAPRPPSAQSIAIHH